MKTVDHTLLRYFGGKWKIAPWIVSHFPPHRIYVEPFCGAASVLIHKEPSYAEVINDLYDEVVNLFEVIRDPSTASKLSALVDMTPYARKEFHNAYQPADDPVEKARRFMVRSWMAFGSSATAKPSISGFRNDAGRKYTLPSHDWNRVGNTVLQVANRIKGVIVENREALEIIERYSASDCLIYADPPYVMETRISGGYRHEMDLQAHQTLLQALLASDSMIVLSGYAHELYNDLLVDWRMVQKAAYAGGAKNVKPLRVECLWMNQAAIEALQILNGVQSNIFDFIGMRSESTGRSSSND